MYALLFDPTFLPLSQGKHEIARPCKTGGMFEVKIS